MLKRESERNKGENIRMKLAITTTSLKLFFFLF